MQDSTGLAFLSIVSTKMRKVFKTVSVTLAIMAVVYGMFLKYIDKTPEILVEPIVLPIIVASSDSLNIEQIEYSTEEPN
jgi:hypothetical protein